MLPIPLLAFTFLPVKSLTTQYTAILAPIQGNLVLPLVSTSTSPTDSIKEVPPILEKIAKCESGGTQFKPDGTVVTGIANPQDIGKWQINLKYHGERAKQLGIDLYTLEGNTLYALILYHENGTSPWRYSSKCWDNGVDAVGDSSIML